MNNKIIPRNLTARASYDVPGNPPSTRPESGVANCYPGLEYDHRNLDRRFFPGLVFEFLARGGDTPEELARTGARVRVVDVADQELSSLDPAYTSLAPALRQTLRGKVGERLSSSRWFLKSISQEGKTIEFRGVDGSPLDGLVVWRLVRSLRIGPVTIQLEDRGEEGTPGQVPPPPSPPVELQGWRRRYTDSSSGVIGSSYRPGELTQSLCSPWMHDFRDCGCTYWASNHPDIVFPEALPGDTSLPGGDPEDPLRGATRIDWLRAERYWSLTSEVSAQNRENAPLQMSHFEINRRWQDLSVVLEDREIGPLYVPRSRAADNAQPYASPEELHQQLVALAGLEHLVALLYLYGRYSLLTREQAEAVVGGNGRWLHLPDDVEFARHQLLQIAVGEMQHLRWVNHILWGLVEAGLIPSQGYAPAVKKPALELPPARGLQQPTPAELRVLDKKALDLFVKIEEPSGYIDGRYARVTATLLDPRYPRRLHELASTIVRDGEEHFLAFRDVQRVLSAYGDTQLPYLRPVVLGDPSMPAVKDALETYQQILDDLFEGYQMGDLMNLQKVATARALMFKLDVQAEALAAQRIGIPYLSLFGAQGAGG